MNEGGVIKTLWYWQGDRHNNQKKQIGNLEIDPQKYIELLFEEGAKTVVLEQRLIGKKINLHISLRSYTKMSSNWVMDLKIRCKTIQLVEKKIFGISQAKSKT